jgi:PAS domain S-box-containing protein
VSQTSREAELEAEIAGLRGLLAEEKRDARRGVEQVRFQARLLDSVHEAVIGTDPSGIVLYWNRFAEGLYGWTAEEAVGRNILELTPAEEVVSDAEDALARLRRGEPWSGEITLRHRDGSTFCAYVSDAPVYDDADRLVAIVGKLRRNRRFSFASFTIASRTRSRPSKPSWAQLPVLRRAPRSSSRRSPPA